MRKLLALAIVLAVSSTAFGQLNGVITWGAATIDGDLSDWSGARWEAFDTVWTQGTSQGNNDFGGGEFSARYTSDGLYVAARITDNDHQFSASGYGTWNGNDYIEIFVDPANDDMGVILYNGLAGGAEWAFGRDNTPDDWIEVNGPDAPAGGPGLGEQYAVAISGSDLIYEAFIPANNGAPVSYFSGHQIGFEVTAFTKFGPAYEEWAAYHAGTGAPGPFNAAGWTTYRLVVPEPFTMSLLGIGGLALIRRRKKNNRKA